MIVKKDSYREKQVRLMLAHETTDKTAYSANLSHWAKDSHPINVEADALAVLADAYAGKYVEVNGDTPETSRDKKYFFWACYEYEDDGPPLLFVHLPHLNNRDVVLLLCKFDSLYGDTNQETTDWALEYQILTRMLVNSKALLVNPRYLSILEEKDSIVELLPEKDKAEYLKAVDLPQNDICEMYQAEQN